MDAVELADKRILIIGGNGYLGTQLFNYLEAFSSRVFVADRNSVGIENEYILDITNSKQVNELFRSLQPHIVFHLAANLNRDRSFDGYEQTEAVNYTGTLNILNALRSCPCKKLIFTSTSEIYGKNQPPFNEEMLPQPVSPYSLTKVMAETAIRTYSDLFGINYTILRLFNFYGAKMPEQFFIPQLISSLKNKSEFKMTHGAQSRDFLHVNDVINALVLVANNSISDNKTYNVCSGNSVSLREVVLELKTLLNSKCQINFGSIPYRDNEIWDMTGDNSKIKKELNFQVKHSFWNLINETEKTKTI